MQNRINQGGGKRSWMTGGVFKKIDAFGKHLPSFNIKGSDKVNTIAGGFFTLILFLTVIMYGALKFSDLITKPNPYISSYFKDEELNAKPLNLNEHNFRIAFTVESYLSPYKQKIDPRYVKYIFRMFGRRNGKEF